MKCIACSVELPERPFTVNGSKPVFCTTRCVNHFGNIADELSVDIVELSEFVLEKRS